MKVLLIGCGSIGLRHLRNLLTLYPDAEIIACDPSLEQSQRALAMVGDSSSSAIWRAYEFFDDAVENALDANCAIVASPDKEHAEQANTLFIYGIVPFYLEKPACDLSDRSMTILDFLAHNSTGSHSCVGYQYRFHPTIVENYARWQAMGYLKFIARDDLEGRYGPNCLSVMAAHPIDTALYVLGDAQSVQMKTDGVSVTGRIWHKGGGLSEYDIAMRRGPRLSQVVTLDGSGLTKTYDLPARDEMYRDALRAWLDWLHGGERDKRTATLAEGWASIEVMRQVKQI